MKNSLFALVAITILGRPVTVLAAPLDLTVAVDLRADSFEDCLAKLQQLDDAGHAVKLPEGSTPTSYCRSVFPDISSLTEVVHGAAPSGQEFCTIIGGAGAVILPPTKMEKQACQIHCDNHPNRKFRRCVHGNTVLKAPPESSRCEIKGGAGAVLQAPFYGTEADCRHACSQFPQNPNRSCMLGNVSVR